MTSRGLAVVTGASSGIGFCIAKRLAQEGYQVWSGYRNPHKRFELQTLKRQGLPIIPIHLDVNSLASVQSCAHRIRQQKLPLEILINNAGFVTAGFWEDLSDQDLEAQFQTNVFGIARMNRALIPIMRKQGHGKIIQIGSASAFLILPVLGAYSATKASVFALTQSMRFECYPYGIEVAEVDPGETQTAIVQSMRRGFKALHPQSPNTSYTQLFEKLALSRMNTGIAPHHVARVVWKALQDHPMKPRYFVTFQSALLYRLQPFIPHVWWEKLILATLHWRRPAS